MQGVLRRQNSIPPWLMWGALGLATAILVIGFLAHSDERRTTHAQVEAQLETIASLKVEQVTSWREERLADARRVTTAGALTDALVRWSANPNPENSTALHRRMNALLVEGRYDAALVVDPDGTVLVASDEAHRSLHPDARSAAEHALESGMPLITDPHTMPGDTSAHIDVIAPLLHNEGDVVIPVGVLILHLEATDSFYPLVQSWPVPSETAETLLVKREGDDALFLNDVRHVSNAALSLRVPLTEAEVPAVMAIGGIEGVVEGVDYRGERVLAHLSRIPDSNWFLVAKVDISEAFAEWYVRSAFTITLTIGLAVLVLAVSGVFWQQIRVSRRDAALEAARAKQVAEQALAESEERLRLALEASGQGLYDLNVQTGLATVNDQYALMLGYDPATFVETNAAWLERLHPDDAERVGGIYRDYTEGKLPEYRVEFRQRTFDGRWRWIQSLGRLVKRDEEGKPLRMLGVHADITERKQADDEIRRLNVHLEQIVDERTEELQSALEELQSTTEELQCSNEELIDASEAKTLFLRSMSHELRTPLNSIIGFSKLILQGEAGPITDEQERQLEMINHSGRHLLELINDILDLSRIEAGGFDIHNTRFAVADVVRDVASTIEPSAADKGLQVLTEAVDTELCIVSDYLRAKQILLNLAGNAVKFTDRGAITLRAWRAAPGTIGLSVRDTGPGIPESDHELIFGEFTQRRRDWRPDRQGTGLGLAISRRLALLLGGTVTVESEPGKGSTFTLLLPEDPTLND
ncbi:MAG: ATP-binding protein [Coriobacteriia bacterium]|nr:ATP-binding protein [Coriobacteriia bacterium]